MSPNDDPDRDEPVPGESPPSGAPRPGPGDSGDQADPSGAPDDTRPIWQAPDAPHAAPGPQPWPPAPSPGQQWEPPRPHAQAPAPPYLRPQPGPYAGPSSGPYGAAQHPAYAQPRPVGRVPGWLWPVVAGMALMVGLLGGTLGGVAVSRSLGDVGGGEGVDIPIIETERGPAPPLEADNGSIAAVAEELLPSTVQVIAGNGGEGEGATGSGFVFDDEGHVITNNHVVAGFTGEGELRVVDHEGARHDATIVGRSPVYDIAVLQVDGVERLPAAALGSSQSMRIGESVVAIGSPLGLSSTVTSGIVSAVNRPVTTGSTTGADESSYINAVQTDAAINPGNSGGPLVNMRGEVIGVNSAIATVGGFGGRAGNIGVGFAIPMEQVRVTAGQILATGEARYPVIGATVQTGGRQGARIVTVNAGTPADQAGLRKDDVVVAIEDKQVNDGIGLIVAIRTYQPGEEVTLTVRRDGETQQVDITLDAKVG